MKGNDLAGIASTIHSDKWRGTSIKEEESIGESTSNLLSNQENVVMTK
jgi:hypothetical protein